MQIIKLKVPLFYFIYDLFLRQISVTVVSSLNVLLCPVTMALHKKEHLFQVSTCLIATRAARIFSGSLKQFISKFKSNWEKWCWRHACSCYIPVFPIPGSFHITTRGWRKVWNIRGARIYFNLWFAENMGGQLLMLKILRRGALATVPPPPVLLWPCTTKRIHFKSRLVWVPRGSSHKKMENDGNFLALLS